MPPHQRLLDHLREGDVLVIWKLDRLSRSLKDLLHLMERVHEAGASCRSLAEAVEMVASGRKSAAEVARLFGVHRSTVGRLLGRSRPLNR